MAMIRSRRAWPALLGLGAMLLSGLAAAQPAPAAIDRTDAPASAPKPPPAVPRAVLQAASPPLPPAPTVPAAAMPAATLPLPLSPPATIAATPAPVLALDKADAVARDVAQFPPQKQVPLQDASRLRTTRLELNGLLDRSVHGAENREVGRVIDVLVGDDGRPAALELDVGGFMGVGNRKIAVAWTLFDGAKLGSTDPLRVALTEAQVKSAPAAADSGQVTVVSGADVPPSQPAPAPATAPADKPVAGPTIMTPPVPPPAPAPASVSPTPAVPTTATPAPATLVPTRPAPASPAPAAPVPAPSADRHS